MVGDVATAQVGSRLITGEELLAMGDIGPCELIDGRIVPMVPTGAEHALIEMSLGGELRAYVASHGLGWVMGGEVGIYTQRDPDRIRAADIAFLSRRRSPNAPGPGYLEMAPDLVVEIVSPSDSWQDVHRKIEEYFAIGVQWLWVVEPDNRAVRVYRSPADVGRLAEDDVLRGEGMLEGFEVSVREIFPS